MSKRKLKVLILFILLCNLAFLLIFMADVFRYEDLFAFSGATIHRWTDLDWQMFNNQVSAEQDRMIMISEISGTVIFAINAFVGIQILVFGCLYGKTILSVPKVWKIAIPFTGIFLYAPCFYYIKYRADYFHLYMELVPNVFLSLVVLALLFIAIRNLRVTGWDKTCHR